MLRLQIDPDALGGGDPELLASLVVLEHDELLAFPRDDAALRGIGIDSVGKPWTIEARLVSPELVEPMKWDVAGDRVVRLREIPAVCTSLPPTFLLGFGANQRKRIRTRHLFIAEALGKGSNQLLDPLVELGEIGGRHRQHHQVVRLSELADFGPVLEARETPLLEDDPLECSGHRFQVTLLLQDQVPERNPELGQPFERCVTTHDILLIVKNCVQPLSMADASTIETFDKDSILCHKSQETASAASWECLKNFSFLLLTESGIYFCPENSIRFGRRARAKPARGIDFSYVVLGVRLELTTLCSSGKCSNQLSYPSILVTHPTYRIYEISSDTRR